MRRGVFLVLLGVLAVHLSDTAAAPAATSSAAPDWSVNATIIEACSCPMFCQCYFNAGPAAHGGHEGHAEHFCRFNNAYQVNKGHYGAVSLDGVKFWVAGDLGAEFSDGQMDWAVLTFDPSVTKEQRDAVQVMLGKLYPVQWGSFTVGEDAPIAWSASKDHAEATLGEGRVAEVALSRTTSGMADQPVVISNLKYWGAPRNDGFVLMPSGVEAYRIGDKPFEFKGTNGFMITFDIASSDVK